MSIIRFIFQRFRFTTLLFIVWFLSSIQLFAQKDSVTFFDYKNPELYSIDSIFVSGVKFLDNATLISLSGLKKGQALQIPGDEISDAITKLWKQGLFSDAKIMVTKIVNKKVTLEIYLQERPKLANVIYHGVKKSEEDDLKEKLNLQRGGQITENLLINSSNKIKDHFKEKGFLKTEVSFVQKEDSMFLNSVNLHIFVDKKLKIKIKQIIFEGNKILPDKKLRRAMKETKQKRKINFKGSKYIVEKFEEDKKNIIIKYNEKGYRDARIVKDTIYDFDAQTIVLKIAIEEGRQYFFRNINWVGNTKYSSETLSKILGIKKGDVYDQILLDKRLISDEDAVGNLYLDDGYLFYNCSPLEVSVANDSIDLEMRVMEGKQATINNILITGNNKTKEYVIRREIRTKPGELFSKTDITRSIRELAQLGYFDPEKLNVNPMPNPAEGTVDIEYLVEEKANDQLELSGGYGGNMLIGTIGVRFNNFSTKDFFKKGAWRPIPSGDGQQLSVRAQTNGKYYQSYNLSFVEPWFGGKKPISFTFSVYRTLRTTGSLLSSDPESPSFKISGAAIGLGNRLRWPDDYFMLYNELSFQQYDLHNWTNGFVIKDGKSNNVSYKITFSRNSIDNPLYTRRGSMFSLSSQLTPPFSLLNKKDYTLLSDAEKYKWIEYHKWIFEADWFTPLVQNLVLHTKTTFGFLGHYNPDRQSPFEGFSLGGDGMGYYMYGVDVVGLRGYENGSLTPEGSRPIYNKMNMELRYPFSLNPQATVYGMLFLEGGNAWNTAEDFNPFDIYRAAGAGLRIFLPMLGMMGIDWGYGFDAPGSTKKSQFHFVLGQQF